MNRDAKIYIAGHTGLVGSSFVRCLEGQGYTNILTQSHSDLDLVDQSQVKEYLLTERPEYVILAAGKVGGIVANDSYPAEFIYENTQIYTNVIHFSWLAGVSKLLLTGSSCIYPKESPQPMREEYLLTGPVEPTSEPFAIAKIAAIRMCQSYNKQYGTNFVSLVSTNVYGPGDNFDPKMSHLVPGLISKFHDARIVGDSRVTLWGTGTPRREFMYVDDLAKAGILLMQNYNSSKIINVGIGEDKPVVDYADIVASVVGFCGEIDFDTSKPDGAPRKLLDNSQIRKLGWVPKTDLENGIRMTYEWYRENYSDS